MTLKVAPAQALCHCAPAFFDCLSDAERLVLPFMFNVWLRPDQHLSRADWSYYGFIAGRGFGKSLAIAVEINRRVMMGEARAIALMAPNEDRCDEVQIQFLIATAPPWFKPERYNGGLIWPNGARAECFTPIEPGRPRSGNFDFTWLCEIVDWQHTTRREAFNNITTATRVGRAQVVWDTTSKGKNDVIQYLMALHKADPRAYPIQRGAMFDNYMLSRKYLATECKKYTGREYDEEVLGLVFAESAGASFQQAWLDAPNRVLVAPPLVQRIVSIDPALSDDPGADLIGFVVGGHDAREHVYVERDLSAHMKPEVWGALAVAECLDRDASGVIIERNHLGDNAAFAIKAAATTRGVQVRMLPRLGASDARPMPRRTPGVIYVREVVAATGKSARASGPAVEVEQGRVHMVGTHPELELELTTYEPGTRRSPNRYDAFTQLVTELRGLAQTGGSVAANAAEAAAAHAELQAGLLRVSRRGARVGL